MGELWLFAGSNGAGKSTFISGALGPGGPLEGVPLLNPDLLTKAFLESEGYHDFAQVPEGVYHACFVQAAMEIERLAHERLQTRQPVCIETVLSTRKYLPLVEATVSAGVAFNFVYVFVNSPWLACDRVAHRVRNGGHPVPREKIIDRYWRSMQNLPVFAARASNFWVYDNSDASEIAAPRLAVQGKHGEALEFDVNAYAPIVELLAPLAPD